MDYIDENETFDTFNCTCPECGTCFRISNPFREQDPGAMKQCKRCGFEWKARTKKPLKCPKCGSYSWDKTVNRCHCVMCEHEWVSRTEEEPVRCPKCKSVKWNRDTNQIRVTEGQSSESDRDFQQNWIWKKYNEGMGCFEIAVETGLPYFQIMDVIRERTGYSFVKP